MLDLGSRNGPQSWAHGFGPRRGPGTQKISTAFPDKIRCPEQIRTEPTSWTGIRKFRGACCRRMIRDFWRQGVEVSLGAALTSHDPTVKATLIARHTTRTRYTIMWGRKNPYSPCEDVPYQTWQHHNDEEAIIASPLSHICSYPNPFRPQKEVRVSVAAVSGTSAPMSFCFARSR